MSACVRWWSSGCASRRPRPTIRARTARAASAPVHRRVAVPRGSSTRCPARCSSDAATSTRHPSAHDDDMGATTDTDGPQAVFQHLQIVLVRQRGHHDPNASASAARTAADGWYMSVLPADPETAASRAASCLNCGPRRRPLIEEGHQRTSRRRRRHAVRRQPLRPDRCRLRRIVPAPQPQRGPCQVGTAHAFEPTPGRSQQRGRLPAAAPRPRSSTRSRPSSASPRTLER